MSYLEHVRQSPVDAMPPMPEDSLRYTLSLRTGISLAATETSRQLELDRLSTEDQKLFTSRIFGGMATKLAIGSHYSEAPSLYDLPDDDRLYELEQLTQEYAAKALPALQDGSQTLQSLLIPSPAFDTMASIPNTVARSQVFEARRAEVTNGQRLKSLLTYINVFPNTYPPQPFHIKSVGDNDVLFTQAFGRDSITDEGLVDINREYQRHHDDDQMMGYLDAIDFIPGPSNDAMADAIVENLLSSHPLEQVIQWEVTYSIYQRYPGVFKRYRKYLHTVWPKNGFYPTSDVKKDSVIVMERLGLLNPIEFAQGEMEARAVAILVQLGVQPDVLAKEIPYDPNSTQPHVKNKVRFLAREVLTRVHHIGIPFTPLKKLVKF